jgi:SSS family solute:Na+ symporter
MQLLGGIWIAQIVPSVVIGAFTRWLNPWALLLGWAGGMTWGTWMAEQLQLKSSVYPLHLFGGTYAMYAAVPALLLNLGIAVAGTLLARAFNAHRTTDTTATEDYIG